MGKKKTTDQLGRRERQIMDVIFEMGEGSVGDVLGRIADPPSYSSVRTMLRHLESKGYLRHRNEGNKYIYKPTLRRETASRSAIQHLIKTFFGGSATETVAAILGDNTDDLSEADLERLEALIDQAKKEGK
ncbi:MAG: BlaI/MecI/CopY family transcriptional regulator [Mariniblastus sp.]